jgi:hypothetical protein
LARFNIVFYRRVTVARQRSSGWPVQQEIEMRNPKRVTTQIARIGRAWQELAPNAKFAGYTVDQYNKAIQDSLDSRDTIAGLRTQLTSALARRFDADREASRINELVVNAVKGDPDYGSDSDLYDSMGFVRKSRRKSGLKRNGNGHTPTLAAVKN